MIPGGAPESASRKDNESEGQVRVRWSRCSNPGVPKIKHIVYRGEEATRALTMNQIKMRSRPHGIPPNANRNDFRNDTWRRYPDALRSVGRS